MGCTTVKIVRISSTKHWGLTLLSLEMSRNISSLHQLCFSFSFEVGKMKFDHSRPPSTKIHCCLPWKKVFPTPLPLSPSRRKHQVGYKHQIKFHSSLAVQARCTSMTQHAAFPIL